MYQYRVLLIGIVALGLAGAFFLRTGDPARAQTAGANRAVENWCNPDGPWGDGRCDAPPTQAEQDWMWVTGWYLGQYYSGERTCEEIPYYVQVMVGCVQPDAGGSGVGGGVQVIQTACGWTVVFTGGPIDTNSPGTDQVWDQLSFSVVTYSSQPTCNHTIHGNNNDNTITGGTGNDTIHGYDGNDVLNGGAGNDVLNGGDETCSGDICSFTQGSVGDTLDGGEGNDVLNGGNETCDGADCNIYGGIIGDTLNGGPGDDTLNGGDESCIGTTCNSFGGSIGDTLNGGTGNDSLNGGNEFCAGTDCNTDGGSVGDILNANDAANTQDNGVDTLVGGTETDNGSPGGSVGDSCQSTGEDSPANASGGDC